MDCVWCIGARAFTQFIRSVKTLVIKANIHTHLHVFAFSFSEQVLLLFIPVLILLLEKCFVSCKILYGMNNLCPNLLRLLESHEINPLSRIYNYFL